MGLALSRSKTFSQLQPFNCFTLFATQFAGQFFISPARSVTEGLCAVRT